MFWGLILEPKKRYTQKVQRSFHVSMAALDLETVKDDKPIQVMFGFEGRNYLLCTLQKGKVIQCPLDLNFEISDEITFASNGNANVHLSGYILEDDDLMMDDTLGEEEEEEETELEERKSKKLALAAAEDHSLKRKKKNKENIPAKKSKTAELLENTLDSKDDTDDSDFSLDLDSDEADNEEQIEEEDVDEDKEEEDEDEGDDDEEEDEFEDEEMSDLEDEVMEEEKPKLNGTTPKSEKKKNTTQTPNQKKKLNESRKSLSEKKQGKETPSKTPQKEEGTSKKRVVEGGVIIEDIKLGGGAFAKPGKTVQVYYEGRFKNNNKLFDSTNKGPGFKFRLGRQEVIKGWDVGVVGMKVGGKRRITCPPNMAYGQKGSPPAIPPNSTLVFDVELKNVS